MQRLCQYYSGHLANPKHICKLCLAIKVGLQLRITAVDRKAMKDKQKSSDAHCWLGRKEMISAVCHDNVHLNF